MLVIINAIIVRKYKILRKAELGKTGITVSIFDRPFLNELPVDKASFALNIVLLVCSIRETNNDYAFK